MFSSMVRSSQVPAIGSWNTRATLDERAHTGLRVMSTPSMSMRPESTSRSPDTAFRKVDLPAPFEPMTVTNWPDGISSDSPHSARVSIGVPALKVIFRSLADNILQFSILRIVPRTPAVPTRSGQRGSGSAGPQLCP